MNFSIDYPTFVATLKQQVSQLSYNKSLNFALTICRDLLPDYQRFSQTENWGDPVVLESAIALAEQSNRISVEVQTLPELLTKVDAITPHMDDFGNFLGSYALNACVAVYYLLQYMIDQKPEYMYNVGIAYTDTIHFKIAEEDEDITEEELAQHPDMLQAWNRVLDETR
jgi:uncharacterized protein YjaG (DUF416 family)